MSPDLPRIARICPDRDLARKKRLMDMTSLPSLPHDTDPALTALPGIRHAFCGKAGGVSTGIYASLNCGPGSSDAADAVVENRARVAGLMGVAPDRLLTVYQCHSAEVVTVSGPWEPGQDIPRVDGLVTRTPGLALGALAADCAPVLLADARAGVIGAVHAGWKGAIGGVTDTAVDAMEALGAHRADIVACVGPCIGPDQYEVGAEFQEIFLAEDAANERFFHPGTQAGHPMFDLPGYVVARLGRIGVGTASWCGLGTLGADTHFSYRASRQRGHSDYGRNISTIALLT
jgi:polyphenol oxidase